MSNETYVLRQLRIEERGKGGHALEANCKLVQRKDRNGWGVTAEITIVGGSSTPVESTNIYPEMTLDQAVAAASLFLRHLAAHILSCKADAVVMPAIVWKPA